MAGPPVLTCMDLHKPPQSATIIDGLRLRKTYLTTAETMGLIRYTRNTLCAMVREGRIPAIRQGNGYLFDPTELASWLEARRIAA